MGCVVYLLISLWARAEESFPYDKILQQDAYLGHRNLPNANVETILFGRKIIYQTNSDGYRDIEFSQKKKSHQVLVVGASWTFGLYLNADERWSDLLEKELCDTSVSNLSVPGYSVDQVYLLTKIHMMAFRKYDIIIAQVPHFFEDKLHLSQISWHPDSRKPYFKKTTKGFQLVRADEKVPFNIDGLDRSPDWLAWILRGYNRLLYDYILFPKSEKLSRETLQYLFQEWIDLAKINGVKILFLIHDKEFYDMVPFLSGNYQTLDFSDSLSAYKVSRRLGHLNAGGNRIILEKLLNVSFLNQLRQNSCSKK